MRLTFSGAKNSTGETVPAMPRNGAPATATSAPTRAVPTKLAVSFAAPSTAPARVSATSASPTVAASSRQAARFGWEDRSESGQIQQSAGRSGRRQQDVQLALSSRAFGHLEQ